MEFLTDPYGWWIEPFAANPFMRDALMGALLAVLTTSVVGVWVILRGMSFLGDALAHGVLPGIALAFVLGVSTSLGALVAAIAMVAGVQLIRSTSPFPDDTSIGILFVGFLALAVVIMSSGSAAYAGDLNRFLFGSVTGVDDAGLVRQAVVAGLVLAGSVLFYRAFLVMTFDRAAAQLLGLRPRLAEAALLALLALAIVASFEAVGSLLVFAFLVAPPATAALIGRRVPAIMLLAMGIGVVAALIGLLVSYHHGSAAGATMALVAVGLFFVALAGRTLAEAVTLARRRRASAASAG